MKQIQLTKGFVASVDDCDFLRLWLMGSWHHATTGGLSYAAKRQNGDFIYMHRVIAEWAYGKSALTVDHIDGDTLNNQRHNLRYATKTEQQHNKKCAPNKSSDFKGVYFDCRAGNWVASIYCRGHKYWLGSFDNELNAAKAYDIKARELFGSFARLNFP